MRPDGTKWILEQLRNRLIDASLTSALFLSFSIAMVLRLLSPPGGDGGVGFYHPIVDSTVV